jgi:hypothetical protein
MIRLNYVFKINGERQVLVTGYDRVDAEHNARWIYPNETVTLVIPSETDADKVKESA